MAISQFRLRWSLRFGRCGLPGGVSLFSRWRSRRRPVDGESAHVPHWVVFLLHGLLILALLVRRTPRNTEEARGHGLISDQAVSSSDTDRHAAAAGGAGRVILERAGMINIGIEGVMLCGAFGGFYAGWASQSPFAGALVGLCAARRSC